MSKKVKKLFEISPMKKPRKRKRFSRGKELYELLKEFNQVADKRLSVLILAVAIHVHDKCRLTEI